MDMTINEYMGKQEQEYVADLTELFLEQSNLFDQVLSSTKDPFACIHQELKVLMCTPKSQPSLLVT